MFDRIKEFVILASPQQKSGHKINIYKGLKIMFAHIYKGKNKTWNLIISRSAAITAEHIVIEYNVPSKIDAKRIAKEYNAKAWNY